MRQRAVRADAETRRRLLEEATRLFCAHGFRRVTVREISRAAGANLAAVNYHFGDKLGLYKEIIGGLLETIRRSDPTLEAPPGSGAADRIRHYVRTWLPRAANPEGPAIRMQELMAHEMQEPTPLAPWIAEQVIVPRVTYLAAAVAELLHCRVSDRRVGRCVISLQAQCLFHLPNRFRRAAMPAWDAELRADLAGAAEHVADFSLAAILRMATRSRRGRTAARTMRNRVRSPRRAPR